MFLTTSFCASLSGGNCPTGTLAASFRSSPPARHPSMTISISLLDDLSNGTSADSVPAFANREPQALLQADWRDQRHFPAHVITRHPHLPTRTHLHTPLPSFHPQITFR